MNEALPRWRSFTSPAVEPEPAEGSPTSAGPLTGSVARRPVMLLTSASLGGAAAGAALALLAVAVLGVSGAEPASTVAGSVRGAPAIGAPAGGESGTWAGAGEAGGAGDAGDSTLRIVVDIGGAVARPGILRLREGDRVVDAIEAAGGYGPRVDLAAAARSLNLAQPLADGSKVVVPELGIEPVLGEAAEPGSGGLIDLNSADQAALESLPGIGPVTAGKIMAARSERSFSAVEDLLERGLVGDAVFEDIVDQVRVGG